MLQYDVLHERIHIDIHYNSTTCKHVQIFTCSDCLLFGVCEMFVHVIACMEILPAAHVLAGAMKKTYRVPCVIFLVLGYLYMYLCYWAEQELLSLKMYPY